MLVAVHRRLLEVFFIIYLLIGHAHGNGRMLLDPLLYCTHDLQNWNQQQLVRR
jgi:hypothetical protein